ncbi:flavodoxin family protein [Candidatus Bathyarchaeota archaeon]|nr:flavodoxin family protein [Candidatus Bathyarchaeota archaeon]MBS7630640.1 flavodoxin family protein [Candidatus Bathyarchaeota archaeon]
MKVFAIQSSVNIDGLTSSLVQSFLKGFKNAGGEAELAHLCRFDVKPCIACDGGWGMCRKEGKCILKDDFETLRGKIYEADAHVFATPVYWHDLSESAKIFLDRLRRCESFNGFRNLSTKKAIGIASAGGSGMGAVKALLNLEDYLRRLGFQIFDLIPITRISKDYKLEMLEKAGYSLAKALSSNPL